MSVALQDKQDTIDQVLDKIKQAIEKGSGIASDPNTLKVPRINEDVLELSEAIETEGYGCTWSSESSPLSALITNFTQRVNNQVGKRAISEREVEAIFREMLRPYLKSWLNSNLHAMVKPVLESEVRIILKKLFNGAH